MRYFASASAQAGSRSQQLVAVVVEVADHRHVHAHHPQPLDDARHRRRGFRRVDRDAHQLRTGAPQFGDLFRRRRRRRRYRYWSSTARRPARRRRPARCRSAPAAVARRGAGPNGTGSRRSGRRTGNGAFVVMRHSLVWRRMYDRGFRRDAGDGPPGRPDAQPAQHAGARPAGRRLPADLGRGRAERRRRGPASGHLYFTLKDARAQVRCAMFKPKSTLAEIRPARRHARARARHG